jgi:hypothetical protein
MDVNSREDVRASSDSKPELAQRRVQTKLRLLARRRVDFGFRGGFDLGSKLLRLLLLFSAFRSTLFYPLRVPLASFTNSTLSSNV